MIRPDLMFASPKYFDFPWWRWVLEQKPDRFDTVINVWHNADGPDFMPFVESVSAAGRLQNMDIGWPVGDWRQHAMDASRDRLQAEWLLMSDQDFCPDVPDEFFDRVFTLAEDYDVVSYDTGGAGWHRGFRLDPGFILVRRSFLDRTRWDFNPHPDSDQFGWISDDLYAMKPRYFDIHKLDTETPWTHYRGVTSNWHTVFSGGQPYYQSAFFRDFIRRSLAVPVQRHPEYERIAQLCLQDRQGRPVY